MTSVLDLPIGILGQVWYLIVSIPDLCTITYFYEKLIHNERLTYAGLLNNVR